MAYNLEQTAENLRVLRARRKVTLSDAADAMGINAASLSQWERGANGMTLENATKVADFYEVSLDELAGRS